MICNSDNVQGGCIDSSIEVLVEDYPEVVAQFPLALVTYIDSVPTTSLPSIQGILKESGRVAESLGTGILVPGDFVVELGHEHNFFNGFDEVWFYYQRPTEPKPENVVISGPRELRGAIPPEVIKWTCSSYCLLGLGDGICLNYVTVDQGLADFLANL